VPWPRRPANCPSLCGEARVLSQVSPCEVSGAPSSSGTGFCPNTSGFVRVRQFLSQYFGFPLLVPLHQCPILNLHVALTRRANERNLGTFQKVILSRKSVSIGQKFHLVFKRLICSIGSYINDNCDLETDTDRRAVGAAALPPGQVQPCALLKKKFLLI